MHPWIRGLAGAALAVPTLARGYVASTSLQTPRTNGHAVPHGPLRASFEAITDGPGVWKWRHYLDAYDQWFARFRNQPVHVLEIGIYSGGSLKLWRDYFGPQATITGVDIAPECQTYADPPHTRVFIGDQGDRAFWSRVLSQIEPPDLVIDDGSHRPEHQIVTLECVLPHVTPGGLFVVEDAQGVFNGFNLYLAGLLQSLHAEEVAAPLPNGTQAVAQPLQRLIAGVHVYPYVTIFERHRARVDTLQAVRHGTSWQPFRIQT
jgi:hypothetical protein